MTSKLSAFAFINFLFLILWSPLPLGSNRPWAWSLLELHIFIIFLCVLYAYQERLFPSLKQIRFAVLGLAAVLVWMVIQIIPLPIEVIEVLSPSAYQAYSENILSNTDGFYISLDTAQTHKNILKTFSYLLLFICTFTLLNNFRRVKYLLFTVTLSGVIQAVYGSFEVLSGITESLVFELPVTNSATGTFVYRNHYANYLVLTLSLGIGFLISTMGKREPTGTKAKLRNILSMTLQPKALVRLSVALIVIALVLSRSRMGNIAFYSSLTATFFIAFVTFKSRPKGFVMLCMSMLIVDILIVSSWFGLDKVQERLMQTSLQSESRDEVVLDSIPLLEDYWLTGIGSGSYYSVFPGYQDKGVGLFYDHAHNDYLEFAIELGIPTFCLLVFLVFAAFLNTLWALRYRKRSILKGTAFGCVMAIISMQTHMFVDFPLQAPANAMLYVIILALTYTARNLKMAKAIGIEEV